MKLTFPSSNALTGPIGAFVRQLLSALVLGFSRVPNFEVVSETSNSVAGNAFLVYHNLGRTPRFACALPSASASVYATDADRRLWNSKSITLRASAASTKLSILILAND